MHEGFWRANLQGKDHMEDLGLDGKILNWILKETERTGVAWNVPAQDKGHLRDLVDTVMNFMVP